MVIATGCDWPMFRFEPDHSGFTPDTSIRRDAVASGSLVLNYTASAVNSVDASPAVVNGVVYFGTFGPSPPGNRFYAFDANGSAGCSGTPKTCSPLWTAAIGSTQSAPAVASGVVYVGSYDDKLYAFDAAGSTNCSGSPKTCTPLWTATTGGGIGEGPTVVNGVVYVVAGFPSGVGTLYAFDAAGTTNCSGSPKTCAPLWTASTGGTAISSPAVVNGVAYIGSGDNHLYAFDAAGGDANCTGVSPNRTCTPLWTAATNGYVASSPAVVNGVVYVGAGFFVGKSDNKLYAFDAAGSTNCSGSPKTCTPLWTATTGDKVISSPAVANGVVYVGSFDNKLYAFDAVGSTNCSGSPKTCTPLWTATTGGAVFPSPAVANGVVYVDSSDNKLYAFDAAGSTNCSGSPKTCTPLWTVTIGGCAVSSPAVANGVVYVGSDAGPCPPDPNRDGTSKLYAFGLEKIPPTTSVVIPSNGATVSGTRTLLDASASDDVSVSKVAFHFTGGDFNDALIGVATPTQYGWLFYWDTTSVPNGSYTLNSVASDPAGNVGRSATVSITVAN